MASQKIKFQGFEALRVFAIIMVVAGHIGLLQNTAGGIGNKIFFVLSGFLAYFSTEHIDSIRSLLQFYLKKLLRIVPTYWLIIVAAWRMFPGIFVLRDFSTNQSLLLNLCFVRSFGHLWFMQQIMLMYLCAPLLQLPLRWMKQIWKRRNADSVLPFAISAAVIILAAFAQKNFITSEVFCLSGEGSHAQFQIWIFMFGFAAANVYEIWVRCTLHLKRENGLKVLPVFTGIYITCFFLSLFLFVVPYFHTKYAVAAQVMDSGLLRTVLSSLAVLLIAFVSGSRIAGVLGNPVFVILSDISFGIYMVHFFFLGNFRTESGIQNFLSNFLFSMCVAFFIYHFLEQPISEKLKKKSQSGQQNENKRI